MRIAARELRIAERKLRIAMKHDLDRQPLSRPFRIDDIKDGAQGEFAATQSELADRQIA